MGKLSPSDIFGFLEARESGARDNVATITFLNGTDTDDTGDTNDTAKAFSNYIIINDELQIVSLCLRLEMSSLIQSTQKIMHFNAEIKLHHISVCQKKF